VIIINLFSTTDSGPRPYRSLGKIVPVKKIK
jgi:hypothetical protein